ncbi:hypothetical protein Taro_005974 [Colocasia esculenta]|uniref:Uncharacterized protein n=1 Tax=Colocasia esculenta TaxID=4460 RepID=A0A843TZE8_COLES|nr:hypothetical protein [Colocasia esculenta]
MLPSPVWWCVLLVGGPGMEHPVGLPLCWCHDCGFAVSKLCPVATRLLSRCPSPSRWYRDDIGGCDSTYVASGVSVVPVGVSACAPGLACPQDLQVGNVAGVQLLCKIHVRAAGGLQLLLCPVRGECGHSVCSCRGGAVGSGLAGSGLHSVEDDCRQVQMLCSWLSSAVLGVCVPLRLREPTCGVAFTGAELLSVEPVEGVLALLAVPLLLGCVLHLLCVWSSVCALCSAWLALLLGLSRCSMCRVASLVERCNTCLWLLSAWRWLVVSSSEVTWLRSVTEGDTFVAVSWRQC